MSLYHLPLGHAGLRVPDVGPMRHWPLHTGAATRALEQAAQATLPPHTLMQRAALALARWLRALYPHCRHIWVAAGPGNNGGDGLLAAALWQQWARSEGLLDRTVTVSWTGSETHLPHDAAYALAMAQQAGVRIQPDVPAHFDVAVDALLGLGSRPEPPRELAVYLDVLRRCPQPVLQVDLPSGLSPDTGTWFGQIHMPESLPSDAAGPRHTLALLTLKPGLFTGLGRDLAGDLWWDDLDVPSSPDHPPTAWLQTCGTGAEATARRPHASHKGSHGDVLVLGGQGLTQDGSAMVGAALLAARAALHAGAGRVYVGLLDGGLQVLDPQQPELMFRTPEHWIDQAASTFGAAGSAVVCGCGGGAAVEQVLPHVLTHSTALVLDADALNAVARRGDLQELLRQRSETAGFSTVLTPHPLEAARLLGCTTEQVQQDRLAAAQRLAERYQAVVVLKGSGTVICAPGALPCVNATGNAMLATGGTGDVLAGLLGARLAEPQATGSAALLAAHAVAEHGSLADRWPEGETLTASRLSRAASSPPAAR